MLRHQHGGNRRRRSANRRCARGRDESRFYSTSRLADAHAHADSDSDADVSMWPERSTEE
jgi:hypothetical protein